MLRNPSSWLIGLSTITMVLLQMPSALADEAALPQITLRPVASIVSVNEQTWCSDGKGAKGSMPLSMRKIRFYREKSLPKNQQYIIGCFTNRTKETLQGLSIDFYFAYPDDGGTRSHFATGLRGLGIYNLKPNQTVFFKLERAIPTEIDHVSLTISDDVTKDGIEYHSRNLQKVEVYRR
jgi:hypothetical protein